MTGVRALALFSGGLDSILACRVVAAQGVEVRAIKFISPFFGHDILQDPEKYRQEMLHKYGIDVLVEDISSQYLQLLYNPVHGFGKNFNPCIDCKLNIRLHSGCHNNKFSFEFQPVSGLNAFDFAAIFAPKLRHSIRINDLNLS